MSKLTEEEAEEIMNVVLEHARHCSCTLETEIEIDDRKQCIRDIMLQAADDDDIDELMED